MKNADRNKRLSIISALHNKQLIAPFVFDGYCNSEVFETYLQEVLVQESSINCVKSSPKQYHKKTYDVVVVCICVKLS
jgi:hypothetical protein